MFALVFVNVLDSIPSITNMGTKLQTSAKAYPTYCIIRTISPLDRYAATGFRWRMLEKQDVVMKVAGA